MSVVAASVAELLGVNGICRTLRGAASMTALPSILGNMVETFVVAALTIRVRALMLAFHWYSAIRNSMLSCTDRVIIKEISEQKLQWEYLNSNSTFLGDSCS